MKYINEENLRNTSFINKEFQSLWTEILELVPKLTNKWNPSEANESDPLAVLLKLCAIVADKTNYNIDKNILELYPLSLTQLRTAYSVYDSLGYNPKWYISATTDLTLVYNGAYATSNIIESDNVILPQFTSFCDEDSRVVYTTVADLYIPKHKPCVLTVPAIEGNINDVTINGDTKITADNLDALNRLYFPKTNIAQNGVFVSSDKTSFSSVVNTLAHWEQVDDLNTQPLNKKCFCFGVDPITGSVYIEFPSDIGSLIGEGIYVKYITSSGEQGNIKANTINKFLYETTYLSSGNLDDEDWKEVEEEIGKSIDEVISINNAIAVRNGYDPESIESMYRNYKRTANLLDSLVTLLDYQNYILNYRDSSSRPILSNVQVSDRTNDLYCTVPVRTLSLSGEDTYYELYDDIKLTEKEGQTVIDDINYTPSRINAFNIRFYPTDYEEVTSEDKYNKTFVSKDLTYSQEIIDNSIKDVKSINHDYLDIRNPIVIPYSVNAVIYLHTRVSGTDAAEVRANVTSALQDNFNAHKLSFGEAPEYSDILSVMEKADSRIKHIALEPLAYGKRDKDTNKVSDSYLEEYRKYTKEGYDTATGSGANKINVMNYDVTERSILCGATPFTNFDDSFVTDYNQSNTSVSGANSSFTVEINNEEGSPAATAINNITEDSTYVSIPFGNMSVDIDLTGGTTVEDKKGIANSFVENNNGKVATSYKIKSVGSGVKLLRGADDKATYFELKQNEDMSLFSPQYNVVSTYANFLYFICVSKTPKRVPVGKPYRLQEGECIYIFETRTAAKDACGNSTTKANATYKIQGPDAIVKFSDREGRYSYFNFVYEPNAELDVYNMGTYISIDVLEKASGKLSGANGEDTLLMCTNSRLLSDSLSTKDNEYTLRTGEYLLYSDMNGIEVGIISEGSTISSKEGISNLYVLDTSLDDALLGDIGSVSGKVWTTVKSEDITYTLNSILTFGEGYQFAFQIRGTSDILRENEYFRNWSGDGVPFAIAQENATIRLGEPVDRYYFVIEKSYDGSTVQRIRFNVKYSNGNLGEFIVYQGTDTVTVDGKQYDKIVDINKLEVDGIYSIASFNVVNNNGSYVNVLEKDYYRIQISSAPMQDGTLGKFKVKEVVTRINEVNFIADENVDYGFTTSGQIWQDCERNVSLCYKLKSQSDSEWTQLEPSLEGDGWKGIIRLHLNIAENPQKLVYYPYENETIGRIQYVRSTGSAIINGVEYDDVSETIDATDSSDTTYTYVDSNSFVVSAGGTDLVLSPDESATFKLSTYTSPTSPISDVKFRTFDTLCVTEGDEQYIHIPGNSGQYVIVPICFSTDNNIYYYMFKGGYQLHKEFEGKPVSQVGSLRVVGTDANIYVDGTWRSVSSVFGASAEDYLDLTNYIYSKMYNPTYRVSESDLISDPTDPYSYFRENHPFNRYSLAKFDVTLSNIQISPLSIQK